MEQHRRAKFVYETPNGEWRIYSCKDLLNDRTLYNVWKKMGENWEFRFFRFKLNLCFRWFKWNKIISSDEMKFQISKFKPLTDKDF